MLHSVRLAISARTTKKTNLFSSGSYLVKLIKKCQKFVRPTKQKYIGRIFSDHDLTRAECIITFSSSKMYLKNRDIIKDKFKEFASNIELNKKISWLEFRLYHDNFDSPEFIFEVGGENQLTLDKKTKKTQILKVPYIFGHQSRYGSIRGTIIGWMIADGCLKIKDKSRNIMVKYPKTKKLHEIIHKACGSQSQITAVGLIASRQALMSMDADTVFLSSDVANYDSADNFSVKIKKEDLFENRVKLFRR